MSIFKPRSHIAFDIDGIVLDTAAELWNAVTEYLDIEMDISNWTQYEIEKVLDVTREEIVPVYEPILARNDIPFIDGAASALIDFLQVTQEPILFITARRPQFVPAARESLMRELGENIVVISSRKEGDIPGDGGSSNKTELLKLHEIDFLIDDRPDKWMSYLLEGISIGTLVLPWTRIPISQMHYWTGDSFLAFDNWSVVREFLMQRLLNGKTDI